MIISNVLCVDQSDSHASVIDLNVGHVEMIISNILCVDQSDSHASVIDLNVGHVEK